MDVLGIIPARFDSTRFPGKPLVDIFGKTMIRRVYESSCEVIENVIIATDSDKIAEEVESFKGEYILTSKDHKSGTDRCAEAVLKYEQFSGKKFDVIINIQGDEPFIDKEHLRKAIKCFDNKDVDIATLIKEIDNNDDIFNPDTVKVLKNIENFAVCFSRSPIPYLRGIDKDKWYTKHKFYKHIGLYAYKKNVLQTITKLGQSSLEIAESLEQNRWVENGYKIYTEETTIESLSVDTKEDLENILKIYSNFVETL